MEGLDTGDHNFNDAVGLLLHNARHHHAAVGHNEHIDEEREGKAYDHSGVEGRLDISAVVAPFARLQGEVLLYICDDVLKFGDLIGRKFVVAYLVGKNTLKGVAKFKLHLLAAIYDGGVGILGEVGADEKHGQRVGLCIAETLGDGGSGLEMILRRVLEEGFVAMRLVHDDDGLLVGVLYGTKEKWERYKGGYEEGRDDGEDDEGFLPHTGGILTPDDGENLTVHRAEA